MPPIRTKRVAAKTKPASEQHYVSVALYILEDSNLSNGAVHQQVWRSTEVQLTLWGFHREK
jgi:hypothetical protein